MVKDKRDASDEERDRGGFELSDMSGINVNKGSLTQRYTNVSYDDGEAFKMKKMNAEMLPKKRFPGESFVNFREPLKNSHGLGNEGVGATADLVRRQANYVLEDDTLGNAEEKKAAEKMLDDGLKISPQSAHRIDREDADGALHASDVDQEKKNQERKFGNEDDFDDM